MRVVWALGRWLAGWRPAEPDRLGPGSHLSGMVTEVHSEHSWNAFQALPFRSFQIPYPAVTDLTNGYIVLRPMDYIVIDPTLCETATPLDTGYTHASYADH